MKKLFFSVILFITLVSSQNSNKIPFNGVYVKVDSLGNVYTKESGVWKSFFPVCIYSDNQRDHNYTAYTVGGRFNCMIAWNASNLQNIKNAGMKGILDTDPYQEGEILEGKLAKEIRKIKKQGLIRHSAPLLF